MSTFRTIKTNFLEGQKNNPQYLSNPLGTYATTAGWNLYADAAGTSPIDGTGGSPTNLTFTTSSSTPLSGDYSFLFTKAAANIQGEGVSTDFTINSSDQAKTMQISFDMKLISGTFVAGGNGTVSDVTVWIYDVTNSQLIQPDTYTINGASTNVSFEFTSSFQTNYNSTSYRLILHCGSTSALAYTLQFDNFNVSKFNPSATPSITSWQPYNLTIGATTTPPTPGSGATSSALWRRVGDTMDIHYTFQQTAAGSAGSGSYLFPLPSGYSIDTTKITLGTNQSGQPGSIVGIAEFSNTTAANTSTSDPGFIIPYNSTNLGFYYQNAASTTVTLGGTAAVSLSSTVVYLTFKASIPIQGWASNGGGSGDSTGIIAASYWLPSNQTSDPSTPINFSSKESDTLGSVTTGASWKFTANSSGYYSIEGFSILTSSSFGIFVYKNGSIYKRIGTMNDVGLGSFCTVIQLNAGDYIDFRASSSCTVSGSTNLSDAAASKVSISKIPNIQAQGSSAKVYLQYTGNGGTSITGLTTNIDFITKVYDSHGAWNGTTFTAPNSGMYLFCGTLAQTGSVANDTILYINGVRKPLLGSSVANTILQFSGAGYLNAGDTATIRIVNNATLNNNGLIHSLTITSQG